MKLVKLFSYIVLACLLLVAVAISSENAQDVELNLLFVKLTVPLTFTIYISFIAGIVATLISSLLKKLLSKSNA